MIELDVLRQAAAQTGRPVEVTPGFLQQVLAEITAGRAAQAQLAVHEKRRGQCFGLPPGERI